MIDSYRFGEVVIDGRKFTSDVIVFPDRVEGGWWRKEGHKLHPEDLGEVIPEKPEVLVVGTGDMGLMEVPPETCHFLETKAISLVADLTGEACCIYNQLCRSQRVVAALHLTC